MRTADSPSHNRYSVFRCEHGVVTKVNPGTWTVVVETTHSAKTVDDVVILQPYLHFGGGEGVHHMPEVGAEVLLGWPNDNTSPFVMGYLPVASTLQSPDGAPLRNDGDEGSPTDVTYRSGRLPLDPGDMALTGRDRNFVILKRGGVVQIGSTHLAQRFYLPVLNYIKDFSENYSLNTLGGSVAWEVERAESDPSGEAPASWTLYANAYAQDAKASVRVRHTALATPGGGERVAWDVVVAPQGIDPADGAFSGEVYQLSVLMDGTKTEVIGASRSVTVKGNDTLLVEGDQSVRINGDLEYRADGGATLRAGRELVLQGQRVRTGSASAAEPGVLGQKLFNLFASAKWPVAPVAGSLVASPSPDFLINLRQALSRKVFLE